MPSDLFTSGRMIVSCEPGEKTLPYVVSSVGDQCITYASDYPHPDSKWPNTVAPIQKADISTVAKKRILGRMRRGCINWGSKRSSWHGGASERCGAMNSTTSRR